MPGNKYFQKGGRADYDEKVFITKFNELLKKIDREQADGVYSIPNFEKNEGIYKENGLQTGDAPDEVPVSVEEVVLDDDKSSTPVVQIKNNNIKIVGPDKRIYNNKEDPLKAGNWKLLSEDQTTLSKKGDDGIIDIMKFYENRINVLKLYAPMRESLFPGYAKLVRPIEFKYDSGETDVKQTQGQAETELEKTIKELIYFFNEPKKEESGQHNWEQTMIGRLAEFIETHGSPIKEEEDAKVLKEFDRIFKEKSEEFSGYTEDMPDTFFKLLAIFAWRESGMLMKQMETPGGDQGGGGVGDDDEEYTTLVTEDDLEQTKIRNKRIMWFLVILSYVYHLFLFITCCIRMYAFITRVLDIRQQYMNMGVMGGEDLEDRGGFFASFNVFTDIMSIGMVEIVTRLATNSYAVATRIAERVVAQGSAMNARSMERGWASFINDIVTGVSGRATVASGELAIQREISSAMHDLNYTMLELRTDAASVSGGVMNAINGLTTTTAVMVSLIYPTAVTEVHAQASLAATASVITSPTSPYALYVTGGNLFALAKTLIEAYRRVPAMRTFAQSPVSSDGGLLTEKGEEDEGARPPEGEGEGAEEGEEEQGGGGTRHRRKKRGSRNKRKSTKTKKRTYRKR